MNFLSTEGIHPSGKIITTAQLTEKIFLVWKLTMHVLQSFNDDIYHITVIEESESSK